MNDSHPVLSPQQIGKMRPRRRRPAVVLAYASRITEIPRRKPRRPGKWPLWAALFCGGGPIVMATIGFVMWLLLRSNVVAGATAVAMLLGIMMIPLGGGFLVKHPLSPLRQLAPPAKKRQYKNRFRLATILLIANLPVAIGYFAIASYLNDDYVITVQNNSRFKIDGMKLRIGNRDVGILSLRPGATTQIESHLTSYTSISYHLNLAGKQLDGRFDGPSAQMFEPMSDPVVDIIDEGIMLESAGTSKSEHF